jgi:hypothetical protein
LANGSAQKGKVSDHVLRIYVVFTQKEPGVKYRSKVTENGHTERDNPSVALKIALSRQPAVSRRGEGWLKKQRPRVMPGIRRREPGSAPCKL